MEIQVLINNIDRTNHIVFDSIQKEDSINDEKDTLKFQVLKYADRGFVPVIGQGVIMNINGIREFGGAIINIDKSIADGKMVVYDITCTDYTQFLDRKLVLERFDNQTVENIISSIVDDYADGFTYANVNCNIEVKTMLFNRLTISACLNKLAETVGYSWYVDYNKDIHFFAKDENEAPFWITDDNGKYLQNTLKITDDLSQIRNKVVIRGAEERGIVRTEKYLGNGSQETFPLTNKFAELPAVKVDGITRTVGIDYLHRIEDYDCMWSFNEKYIKFKVETIPASGKLVEITGIPLFPIIVSIIDGQSIQEYGVYEFFKEDKSITSREEGLKYARAELQAYKDGVIEGGFQTNSSGLRSGQIITISSTLLNLNEKFLIQKVSFKAEAKDRAIWSVELATMRTVGIIQVLQNLIRFREIREFDPPNILSLRQFQDECFANDIIRTPVKTATKNYVWVDNGEPNPIRWNMWTWAD